MSQMRSAVYLYEGVPLSLNTRQHTKYFKSLSDRWDWFKQYEVKSLTYQSYIRLNKGSVDLQIPYVDAVNINYMRFINQEHEKKDTYCFVSQVEYVSDTVSRIHYEVDPMVTEQFTYSISGLVEREHADTTQKNTIPEEIGTDDYVVERRVSLSGTDTNEYRFAIITTTTKLDNPVGFGGGTNSASVTGVGQPYNFYIIGADNNTYVHGSDITQLMDLSTFNNLYANDDELASKIVSIKVVDDLPIPHTITRTEIGQNTYRYKIDSNYTTAIDITTFGRVIKITRNTPKVKNHSFSKNPLSFSGDSAKLMYYPYSYWELTHLNQSMILKPEHIVQETVQSVKSLELNMSETLHVLSYNDDVSYANTMLIDMGVSLPTVSTNTAIVQQSRENAHLANAGVNAMVGGTMLALGGATGGGTMAVGGQLIGEAMGSVITGIYGNYRALERAKKQPNQIQGATDRLITLANNYKPQLRYKTQSREYREYISEYFHMYGWRVMRMKTPNRNTRPSFNHVKMHEVIITGKIPQYAKEQIEQIYKGGVTLWHGEVGNYHVSNL